MVKKFDEFVNEGNIVYSGYSSYQEFNKYSGITCKDAEKFIQKCVRKIPEWKSFKFDGFYSGYAGYTIYDGNTKIGYLMYDKNQYGLEDCSQGQGWYFRTMDFKYDEKTSKWRDIVKELGEKDPTKPPKARMW